MFMSMFIFSFNWNINPLSKVPPSLHKWGFIDMNVGEHIYGSDHKAVHLWSDF